MIKKIETFKNHILTLYDENSLKQGAGMDLSRKIVSLFGLLLTGMFWVNVPPADTAGPDEAVRLVDLTHPFDQTTIYWPTSKSFELEIVHRGEAEGGFWYEANNFSTAEHGGTHMDAPAHFAEGKWRTDQIPLDRLIAPGIVVDVRSRTRDNPDYQASKSDFVAWERRHGTIPPGSIVLMFTGWENYWPDKKKYLGTDLPGDVKNLHFPGYAPSAARFLTEERRVAAVGLDTPSLDYGQSVDFVAHRIFGAANVPGFENVNHLAALPPKGFRIIALPMKIGQGSGAPLRIVAEIGR